MIHGKGSLFAICIVLLIFGLLEWTEGRCYTPRDDVGQRLRVLKDIQRSTGVKFRAWQAGVGVYREMDIMEREPHQRNGVSLLAFPNARWPNAVVPYVIAGSFSAAEHAMIQQAMQQFAANTCIRFVPRTTELLYITIRNSATGCWSYVGRSARNNENQVNLQSPECMELGTIVHELMHAIGFYHEFTRPDRDEYVSIDFGALAPQYQTQTFYNENYSKMTPNEVVLFGRPYDYGSVMHYSKFAAAGSNTRPVMNNLRPWTGDFGNDSGLSGHDIVDINYMYCSVPVTQPPTVTTTTRVVTMPPAPVTTTRPATVFTTTTYRPLLTLFSNPNGIITTLVQGPITRILEFIRTLPIINFIG